MGEFSFEERRLRRKLTFWRGFFLLILVGIGLSVWAAARARPQPTASPHIARIDISGVITDDRELLERIDSVAKNDAAKALVVSISSPGGTTYGGESIYKALRKLSAKKPVVADVRTLAASAGYMIALGGDHIVAGETSITGSIGVLMQYPQASELLDKIGIKVNEEKSAPLKAEPSPFHPASDEAKAMIRATIMDSYGWFVDLVAERRALPRETVLPLADGRILTGRQALAAKLVDELGGDDEIRAWLETKGVDKALPMVEWKAPSKDGLLPLLTGMAEIFGLTAPEAGLSSISHLREIRSQNLFLDGLLSVWQVGRD
ncbi:MAG: signal peptide peptidase SppA [Proteobacteria bacterium]|nr:signal peptide peptidase SppA [Pseudomonadota bacterium]